MDYQTIEVALQLNVFQLELFSKIIAKTKDRLNKKSWEQEDCDLLHSKYGTVDYKEAYGLLADIQVQLAEIQVDQLSEEPVTVGWVKHCEGHFLRIKDSVHDVRAASFELSDTHTEGEIEYDCFSIALPGRINSWESLDDCLSVQYYEDQEHSEYFFTGEVADKLRQLFSV